MSILPPIPTWEAAHPIVVHFPVALLTLSPLVCLAAAFFPKCRSLGVAAFITIAVGLAGIFIAFESGEAAEHAAALTPVIRAVVHEHEELAEVSRNIFIGVALFAAIVAFVPLLRKTSFATGTLVAAKSVLFAGAAAGAIAVANTAHEGGRLVHEYGVHAVVSEGSRTESDDEPDNGDKRSAPAQPAQPAAPGIP